MDIGAVWKMVAVQGIRMNPITARVFAGKIVLRPSPDRDTQSLAMAQAKRLRKQEKRCHSNSKSG